MLDLGAVFDPDPARRPSYASLVREALSGLTTWPGVPDHGDLPDGRGQPVLVIPAFLTNDLVTRRLRGFLADCGFRAFGWGLGVDWGPTRHALEGLHARVGEISRAHGPVALVGISFGGLLARNLGHEQPGAVRHVVTVASPVRLPTATRLEPVVRLLSGGYSEAVDLARLQTRLPVPSTTIYTRDDGIVAPDSCRPHEDEGAVFEMGGPHIKLCSDPAVMRLIVQRLS